VWKEPSKPPNGRTCIAVGFALVDQWLTVVASDAVPLRPRSGYALRLQGDGECSAMTMSAQTRPVVHPDIKPENPPERSSHWQV
jgi:hypothetical protein